MSLFTLDHGFDFGVSGDPTLKGLARQLQLGGWVSPVGQLVCLCSPTGPQQGDTLIFPLYDFSEDGNDNRNVEIASVDFFDVNYSAINSADVIGDTITAAALTGVVTSTAFGPNLTQWLLQGQGGSSQFQLLMSGRFFIRIQVNVIDITGTVPFVAEQELIIN